VGVAGDITPIQLRLAGKPTSLRILPIEGEGSRKQTRPLDGGGIPQLGHAMA